MNDQSSFLSSSTWLNESLSPLAATTTPTSLGNSSFLGPIKTERLLLPNHQSAHSRALAYCARIDHIKIRDTIKLNGNTHYTIQIFYKKVHSNIPTVRLQGLQPQEMELSLSPDFVKHQRFSTFANLRHEMYYSANNGHGSHPCAFCGNMASLLSDGPTLPRLSLKLFHGNESVSHALEGFVNAALSLTKQLLLQTTAQGPKPCEGQREIPLLLERFLKPADESLIPSQPHARRGRKVTPTGHH